MGRLFEVLVSCFREEGLVFSEIEGEDILQLSFNGENGRMPFIAEAKEDRDLLVFYAYCPVKAPEKARAVVAEFLTRANYGLFNGNFEMDYSDGEVRYKTVLPRAQECISHGVITHLMYTNLACMDAYLPGLMAVIYGGVAPTQAVDQVERRNANVN